MYISDRAPATLLLNLCLCYMLHFIRTHDIRMTETRFDGFGSDTKEK